MLNRRIEADLLPNVRENGVYTFNNIPPAVYRIQPDLTGFVFEPSTVAVSEAGVSPEFQAVPIDLQDEGCLRTDYRVRVVQTDEKSHALLTFAQGRVRSYLQLAAERLQLTERDALVISLDQAMSQVQFVYAGIVRNSLMLPKITLACPNTSACRDLSYQLVVRNYRTKLARLKTLAHFIHRRARKAMPEPLRRSATTTRSPIETAYRRALNSARHLPAMTAECAVVGSE